MQLKILTGNQIEQWPNCWKNMSYSLLLRAVTFSKFNSKENSHRLTHHIRECSYHPHTSIALSNKQQTSFCRDKLPLVCIFSFKQPPIKGKWHFGGPGFWYHLERLRSLAWTMGWPEHRPWDGCLGRGSGVTRIAREIRTIVLGKLLQTLHSNQSKIKTSDLISKFCLCTFWVAGLWRLL